MLFGSCAGVVAGVAWYLIVLGTTSMQTYLLPAFGVVVSYAVYAGMRRPGHAAALISLAITAVSIILSMYYVERHLVVQFFSTNNDSIHIPFVPYLDWLAEVLHHALTKSPSPIVYSLLALVAAGWFGHQGFDPHDQHLRHS